MWTEKYKEFLEKHCIDTKSSNKKQFIQNYEDNSTESTVNIVIKCHYKTILSLRKIKDGINKKFGLIKPLSITNMHLYNQEHHVEKYNNVLKIIKTFVAFRIDKYNERKKYWLSVYENELVKIENKVRFILEIINDTLDVRKKKYSELELILQNRSYPKYNKTYDYLLKMPIHTLTQDSIDKLTMDRDEKKSLYDNLQKSSIKDIWLSELHELFDEYKKYKKNKKVK